MEDEFENLMIRDGVVNHRSAGYVLCSDKTRDDIDDPHTVVLSWRGSGFIRGEANFSQISCCMTQNPALSLLRIGYEGDYAQQFAGSLILGNIHNERSNPIDRKIYGDVARVRNISGRAHAIGSGGSAYRQVAEQSLEAILSGTDPEATLMDVDGFSHNEIYAVGLAGKIFRFDGKRWHEISSPTNVMLTGVHCAPDGKVYISGTKGTIISGRHNSFAVYDIEVEFDFRGISSFSSKVFVASGAQLFEVGVNGLVAVQFGLDRPVTTGSLSEGQDVLWSIGEQDVLSFDGENWSEILSLH